MRFLKTTFTGSLTAILGLLAFIAALPSDAVLGIFAPAKRDKVASILALLAAISHVVQSKITPDKPSVPPTAIASQQSNQAASQPKEKK